MNRFMHSGGWLAASAALWLLTGAAMRAQEQQGSLAGSVRDSAGSVMPGVIVSARNQAGLALEMLSDGQGGYRFQTLPPGDYELTARLDGFVPVDVKGIDLRLGRQLTIDLVLHPAGPAETVTVPATSPLIAITQSARTTSVRDDEIEKMPKGRDFTSLATQVSGANDERKLGGLSVDGSSAAENRFIIDGIETTDFGDGRPGEKLVTDFVEELQVKSSGYSAEYGGSTGAILNVVTRSGTNVWHGDALFYWSGDALDAGPRPTLQLNFVDTGVAEYVTYPEDKYRRTEPGFTAGGPLVRDRLWMFAGYVPSFQSLRRTVTFFSDGSVRSFPQTTDAHHITATAMAKLGTNGRARAAFNNGGDEQRGLLPAPNGSGNPNANTGIDTVRPSRSASLNVDHTPTARWLLGVHAGYFSNNLYNRGIYQGDRYVNRASSVGLPGVPPEYQRPPGYSNVATTATGAPANIGVDHAREERIGFAADLTTFIAGYGQHQLKAGLQLEKKAYDEQSGSTGNGIGVFWNLSLGGQRGPFGYYSLTSNTVLPDLGAITQARARVANLGLFVQDNWQLTSRVTLNLGLRTENERVPSFSADPRIPETAIHFGFSDKLAPRLGVAWDLTGDGKTKAYGSWGMFYDIMKLHLPVGYFGGFKAQIEYYTLDSGDLSAIVDNPSCPPACPGRHLLGPIDMAPPVNDPEHNMIDPGIDQMRLQEAAAGVERELRQNLSIGVRYIHKHLDRAVEDIGLTFEDDGTTVYMIGNPGFGGGATFYPKGSTTPIAYPKARRRYNAVEAALDRRLSSGWSTRASYTWSRLSGNYSGLSQSDEDGRVSPNAGFNFDYPMMSFDERGVPVYGVLATDRPHQLKASVLVELPFGTSVGVQGFAASGVARTRVAQYIPGQDLPIMYRGRHSDGRLPPLSQIDLYAQHLFHAGGRWHVALSANVINLLNTSTVTNYHARELFQGQAIRVDETQFYQGVDTQQLIARQALTRDARFLMDSGYQPPLTMRIGVKIGF